MSNLENMHQNAMALYEEKNLEEALKAYQEIIKINPISLEATNNFMHIRVSFTIQLTN